MTNHFMTKRFHPTPNEGGEGCRHTECDHTGRNCLRHGEDRSPEDRRGFDGAHGPHGGREFDGERGLHGGREFDGERGPHGGRGPHHAHRPEFLSDDSLRSVLLRAAQSMHHPQAGASQELVLRILAQEGEMDQRVLRSELHIQPGSLSELLGKLEQKGLIARERNDDDRRRVTVRLTDAGQTALSPGAEAADDPFAALTAQEQTTLRTLLEKLLADD